MKKVDCYYQNDFANGWKAEIDRNREVIKGYIERELAMQAEIDELVFYIKAQHAVLQEHGWTSYQQDKKVEGLVRKLKQEKE